MYPTTETPTVTTTKPSINNILVGLLWALATAISCLVIVLIYRSRSWGIQWDSAYLYYIAWLITEGAVPYRDIFDVNFPGTYFIYLFVMKFMGTGNIHWRIFDLLCLAATNFLIVIYCRPFGKLAVLLAVALFSAFHLYNGPMYMGQRDYLMLMFLLGSLYCLARYMEQDGGGMLLLFGGLSLGYALLIKPQTGLLGIFILAFISIHGLRTPGRSLRGAVFFVTACGLIPACFVILMWHSGGLVSLFDIFCNRSALTAAKFTSMAVNQTAFLGFFGMPQLAIYTITLIIIAGCIVSRQYRIRRLLLSVSMIYGLCNFYLQSRCLYQFYPFVLFMFMGIASLTNCFRTKKQAVIRCVVLIVLVQFSLIGLYRSSKNIIAPPPHHITTFRLKNRLVLDLSRRLKPGETVQVMECLSGCIHALYELRCKQPTRFLFDGPFFQNVGHPYIQKIRQEFLGDLQASPPAYFVISVLSWPIRGYERLDTFPELKKWLNRNYRMESDPGFYHLYRRID